MMSGIDKRHSRFRTVYAIVRFDFPVSADNPENTASVVKVFSSKIHAEREIARLSEVNAQQRCKYVLQTTRLMPYIN